MQKMGVCLALAACLGGCTGPATVYEVRSADGQERYVVPPPASAPRAQETAHYKMEDAGGVIAQMRPQSAAQSTYRYTFAVSIKTPQAALQSVRVERMAAGGTGAATLLVEDAPRAGALATSTAWRAVQPQGAQARLRDDGKGMRTWLGQSGAARMTAAEAPWLYERGNSKQLYRITLRDAQGHTEVIYQEAMTPENAKEVYRKVLGQP